ncbi:MAG: D-alanyl-D-alanine carboxypeptidase [Austwickia sp.]|nr:D-alanyl-D-alanine carboxypeptidase [Austwickia sp.]
MLVRPLAPALALALAGLVAAPLAPALAGESDQITPFVVPEPSGLSNIARSTSGVAAGAGSSAGTSAALRAAASGVAAARVTSRLEPALFQAAMVSALRGAASSRYLSTRMSGMVLDAESGEVLWSHYSYKAKMPASTQKVMTAFTVLRSMNPEEQFVTTTSQSVANPGNVYLTGAGDPSLTATRLKSLALRTATALKAKGARTVNVYVDESVFPAPTGTPGWKASYLRSDVQVVRGLTLAGYRGKDGAAAAGAAFAKYLTAYKVTGVYRGRGATPAETERLADSWSASVRSMVRTMLAYSVNDYAEYLLRHAARAQGMPATARNAIANQVGKLGAAGISTAGYRAYDGSGLSRSNRMPARTLAETVRALYVDPAAREVAFAWSGMPRAGQTGTLRSRFRAKTQVCAKGRVLAKTGTLNDAVSLAGIAQGSDGRDRAFVLLENGLTKASSVRLAMDSVATAVVGCRLG